MMPTFFFLKLSLLMILSAENPNSRAGSVWIFQIRFDSVFNLKYSVFSVSAFAHYHNARVS